MDEERKELLDTFHDESLQRLAEAEALLLSLEREETTEAAIVPVVFRHVHSLKGDGSLLELKGIVEIAHAAEEMLDRVRGGKLALDGDRISLLLKALDAARARIAVCGKGDDTPLSEGERQLCAQLQEKTGKLKKSAAAEEDHEDPAVAHGNGHHLRVSIEKLDAMLRLCGELSVLQGRNGQLLIDPVDQRAEMAEVHRLSDRLFQELQEQVMVARLVPIATALLRPCQRLVRDLGKELGKPALFATDGGDAAIDTALVEPLREALVHMIRNAIDHGIESAPARRAAGKPAQATVRFSAVRESGALRLTLEDDGAGLNDDKLRVRARALGLPEGEGEDTRMLRDLIFRPGFSTVEKVTHNSGRGVGMDVVRRNIEGLRGRITVDSEPGKGTRFVIRLPLSLSIMSGFAVASGDETYLVPMEAVRECLSLDALPVHEDGDSCGVVELRGGALSFVRLRRWFHQTGDPLGREKLLVLDADGIRLGLAVEKLIGETQAVIRPLAAGMKHAPEISGSTIQGDGTVALLLDVNTLARAVFSIAAQR